jgi:hypothetical protein
MSVDDPKDTTHRFADVAGEPCATLAPIEGFNKKPLVTLEEATEPLKNIVPRISAYVYVAKQRATNPANNLSTDESASIALYTMEWEPYTDSLYYILNSTLRSEDRQNLKPWFLYLKLILTALSRLPSISVTVYRGVRNDIESNYPKYQAGKEVIWWGFSSCSKDKNISEKDQFIGENGRRTLFIINCLNGKDISKHSYFKREKEVLLKTATTVKVINNEYQGHGLHVIRLKEIEPSISLVEEPSSSEEIKAYLKERSDSNKTTSLSQKMLSVEHERYFNPKLSEYIAKCKPRSEIFLIGKRFNENDIEIIVQQLIIERECRELFLRESGVTSQGALAIADGLLGNKTLERLFISHNTIGDMGAKGLAESLSHNNNVTLKQLCLGYNGITDDGIEHIADMLASNKTLTHLWLSSNEISDRGLKRLVDVLTHINKTLQVLALEWNKFRDDSSVNLLINMVNNNRSLTKLSLNSCKLSKNAIKQLKHAAKEKKNFELTIH